MQSFRLIYQQVLGNNWQQIFVLFAAFGSILLICELEYTSTSIKETQNLQFYRLLVTPNLSAICYRPSGCCKYIKFGAQGDTNMQHVKFQLIPFTTFCFITICNKSSLFLQHFSAYYYFFIEIPFQNNHGSSKDTKYKISAKNFTNFTNFW